jgi:hypothetical protein
MQETDLYLNNSYIIIEFSIKHSRDPDLARDLTLRINCLQHRLNKLNTNVTNL